MQNVIKAALIAIVLSVFAPAAAQDINAGMEAYERGDYAAALREWRSVAEDGDEIAQYNLGVLYANGQGVEQDNIEAFKWWRRSAQQGFVEATFNLGHMYAHGVGVHQDHSQAVRWWRTAANQGDIRAQHALGYNYAMGLGVPQDYSEAVKLWRNPAERGFALSQEALGEMYLGGKGVLQDYVLAHMWSNLAASQGNEEAIKYLDIVTRKMTKAQIAEAQKLARKWRPGKSQSQIENLVEGMVLDNLIPPWLQRVLGAVPITE
jgi:uncharacterized protein